MRMKLVVVLALVIGSAACNHKKDSSTIPNASRDGSMNATGGSTYGGNAYGGNAYGGSKYGGTR